MVSKNINICLACDDNYSIHGGVLIASILANAANDDEISIYILDGGISEQHKTEILSLTNIKKCEINFIDINEDMFKEYKSIKTLEHISFATFYRLKLPTLLPNVDKIIYLDCDMAVVSSLKTLFETDLKGCTVAGVRDIGKKLLRKNPNYVNAGMLIFDLAEMRKDNTEQKFIEYAKNNQNNLRYCDQDIINNACKGNIYILDDIWNVQSSNFTNRSSYTNNPKIIHFIAKRKPWNWASFSIHKEIYFKYRQLTPWKLNAQDYKHWTKDNQIASLFAYLKYRPLFLLRPRFYKALFFTYLKPFLQNIFSITEFSEERNLIKIFGIKIKVQKLKYAKNLKHNPYYYYKKNHIDITKIPPAEGNVRLIQLANVETLKEMDYVCRTNNINYWLDFGTMLGALRHKGFIPWDDDIDTGMMKNDYDKFVEIFNKTTRNPDLYAEYEEALIRIKNKKSKLFFIDIFPYYIYGEEISKNEQLKQSKKLRKVSRYIRDKYKNITSSVVLDTIQKAIEDNHLLNNPNINTDKPQIVWGIESSHVAKNWFHSYDTIFPIKDVEFEGYNFMCMNKPEVYLAKTYGDYMSYPSKIGLGHSAYKNLSQEDINTLQEIIGSKNGKD